MAKNYDIKLRLTRVKVQVMAVLRRDGVIDNLGADHIYGSVYEAAADQLPVHQTDERMTKDEDV